MSLFSTTLLDLRHSLRQLRRAPVFTLTAILTLALGIGANTAVFSLLDQALLRSLPVRDPASLVVLEGTGKLWQGHSSGHGGDPEAYFSVPMYRDLRDRNRVFSGLLASAPATIDLTRNNTSQVTTAELVSGNYFTLLGVQPALGRLFTQADDTQPNANPVAVLSFDFWRDHLGADPTVVGSSVSINGHPFEILGVAAPRFRSAIWGQTPALFVPFSMTAEIVPVRDPAKPDLRLSDHTDKWINILGRLRPGVSRAHAEAAMNPLWHALRAQELKALGHRSQHFTDDFLTHSRMLLKPGARGFSYDRDTLTTPLLAVMGMAALLLLIASVNVASLLLVRSATRVREFSVRYALGAARSRIVRQLLLEGLVIGLGGGLLGIGLAPVAIRVLLHQLADGDSQLGLSPSVDTRLLLFNFSIALAVSLLFSLAPTLQLRRPDLTLTLRQGASNAVGNALSLRGLIVSLQIGLSVLLLIAAGLFVRTMAKLRSADVGFNPTHLVTFGINPRLAGYAPTAVPALHQHVLNILATLPGVQTVAGTTLAELAGDNTFGNVTVAGYTPPPDDDFEVGEQTVSPAYFQTLGIPLLAGRTFADTDTSTGRHVAVVNQAFVQHFCAGSIASCLGRQIGNGGGSTVKLDTAIVGIVHDAKHEGIRDTVAPTVFRPLAQDPSPAQLFLYLRTATPPDLLLPTVRRAMGQLDPALALTDLRTMQDQIDDSLANERLISLLASAFGLLATLLAGVGLYGILAFTTAQRTREIGIRIALGSSRIAITRIVLLDVLTLAGLGIALAIPVAFALGRLLRSQLFGVSPTDPLSLAAAALAIALVALLASLVPARRAASVDPNIALRTE